MDSDFKFLIGILPNSENACKASSSTPQSNGQIVTVCGVGSAHIRHTFKQHHLLSLGIGKVIDYPVSVTSL